MERQSTEETLIEFGVHLGFGEQRKELAGDLERNGLTGGDLHMVCDHVKDQSTSPKTQGARISSVLKDKDRWGPLLVDLRKFHEYRHRKDARMGKKRQEPGKNLREQDQEVRDTGAAAFAQMSENEYANFKWRWCVADWSHGGHETEKIRECFGATLEEIESCVEQFPKGVSFDAALDMHAGLKNAKPEFDAFNKGKANASNTGPD